MALSQKQQGHLIMFVVMSVFALNIPVNKYMYMHGYLSPFAMTCLRMTFGAAAFWIVSLFMPKEKVAKKDMLVLLGGSLCGLLLNQGLFAYGLGQTSPIDASIITTSSPLFAMIIAAIILKEPITIKKIGGVLLGGFGALILVYSSHQAAITDNSGSLTGDMAILSAQVFYSFYLVITRPLSDRYSTITMMKWMFLFAAIFALPLFGKEMVVAPLFNQADILPFALLAFTLIGATFFTYMMIPLAQRRIRPTTISMYNNLQPLIASIVAILLMGEKLTIWKMVAAIFIFGGVYLVTTSKSRKDVEAELRNA